jgi:hypothetical protein
MTALRILDEMRVSQDFCFPGNVEDDPIQLTLYLAYRAWHVYGDPFKEWFEANLPTIAADFRAGRIQTWQELKRRLGRGAYVSDDWVQGVFERLAQERWIRFRRSDESPTTGLG